MPAVLEILVLHLHHVTASLAGARRVRTQVTSPAGKVRDVPTNVHCIAGRDSIAINCSAILFMPSFNKTFLQCSVVGRQEGRPTCNKTWYNNNPKHSPWRPDLLNPD